VLFLIRNLKLKVQVGDRFEISIVETPTGESILGVSGISGKRYKKAITHELGGADSRPPKMLSQKRSRLISLKSPIYRKKPM
jgi:hypothetical protein